MARPLRERASEIKRKMFKFFCFCSAATPASDNGEAPRQLEERLRFLVARPTISPPHQPLLSDDVKVPDQHELGPACEVEHVRQGRVKVPRHHMPRQHMPRQRLPPATAVPCLSEIVQSLAKAEWASILEKKSQGASASIQNNQRGAPRTVEQMTRATPASTSLEDIQRGVPPSVVKTKITSASFESVHVAKPEMADKMEQVTEGASASIKYKKTMAGKVREKATRMRRNVLKLFCFCSTAAAPNDKAPCQQHESIAAPPQPQMSNDVKMPDQKDLTRTRDVASVIEGRAPRQPLPVQRHQVSPAGAVPVNASRGAFQSVAQNEMSGGASSSTSIQQRAAAKPDIAAIIQDITGGIPPSVSIQEAREIYESIERALTSRRNIPVFGTSSQSAPAPGPHFAPGPVGGAVFMPRAAFAP